MRFNSNYKKSLTEYFSYFVILLIVTYIKFKMYKILEEIYNLYLVLKTSTTTQQKLVAKLDDKSSSDLQRTG